MKGWKLFLIVLLMATGQRSLALPSQQPIADYLRQAQVLLSRQDYAAARDAARKALELEPASAAAEYLLGAAELGLGQIGEAESRFRRALEIAPELLEARRGLGATYLKQKRFQEAEREFAHVLAAKPDDFISLYSSGLSLLLRDRPLEALRQFDKARRLNPNDVTLLTAALQTHLRLNQSAQIAATLGELKRQLNALDPRRLQIAFLLGSGGFYDLAIREFEELRQIYPESSQLNYNLALAYHRTRKEAQAVAILESSLAHEENAELLNLLAEIEERRRRYAQALVAYRKAAKLVPQNEDYRFDYAQALVQAGALDEALKVFAGATQDFPASVRMWLGWGATQYLKGNYEEAAQTLLKGAAIAPQAPEVYDLLGRAYEASGNWQSAIERQFTRYLDTKPRDARAAYFYGRILAARGRQNSSPADLANAQRHFEEALAQVDDFAEAHFELGNIFVKRGEIAVARHHLERAVEIDPKFSEALYHLSRLYRRLGERSRAEEALRKFQQLKAQQGTDQNRARIMNYFGREKQ